VGNDIVDLAEAENIGKSRDTRFCRRVFNAEELSMIAASARPDSVLWAIWAAKEAAYKAISRSDPAVCSIPKKYPVILESRSPRTLSIFPEGMATSLDGNVKTPRGELLVRISIADDSVYAIVAQTASALKRVVSRVERIDPAKDDASVFVRQILLEAIASRLGCGSSDLSIAGEKRRPRAPFVLLRGTRLPAEISLTHDGRFVAFTFDPATF
jgi:phosphopantetheine--protein transferase-like protein